MRKLKLDELNRASVEEFKTVQKIPVVVVLDNIRSMSNVGSVFRTSDAFVAEKILLCGITAQPPHREIQKTALGATESVDWEHHPHIYDAVKGLKDAGYIIIGVEQTDSSVKLNDFVPDTDKKFALIMGNEVEGISEEVLPLLDFALEIPQMGTKHSLNVSVAAGIVLYRFFEEFL
ncbi:MAG: TrmH family RNA methyltransferase [Sphingobacteriales bacterium]|nr:MAG: TrmH family RNA methyltransferase [Sphingobacteriales bacterium]